MSINRRLAKINALMPSLTPMMTPMMNVDSLIKWAADMFVLLDQGVSNPGLDIAELRKCLGWLSFYRDDVDYWNRLISIGVAARYIVRMKGIHMNIVDSFEQAISSVKMGLSELEFADQLTGFLLSQSVGIQPGQRFIGSTEALESLFGKIKYMEREQRAFGFTSLLLAAMAAVGPIDEKTVAEAMMSVKISDQDAWAAKEIGQSVQSQRRQIKKIVAGLKAKVTKLGPEVSGTLERAAA